MLPLSLQSVLIYNCPCRTSRFLEAVATTQTTMTLPYNTQQSQNFLPFSPSGAMSDALRSTTLVYLAICNCCSQRLLCHRSYACTCLDHELDLCGWDAVHAHVQLCRAYLMSTFDVTHGIKCTRLSPSLAGEPGNEAYFMWLFEPCQHLCK